MVTQKDVKWMKHCVSNAELFSTCGKRQYYAVILDDKGHHVGSGWNGGPKGMEHCKDGGCPRLQAGSAAGTNYDNCIAIHAEQNALLHSEYQARKDGGTIYVNGSACFGCAKLIANSGLTRLVCLDDPAYLDWPRIKDFLAQANVAVALVPEFLLEP